MFSINTSNTKNTCLVQSGQKYSLSNKVNPTFSSNHTYVIIPDLVNIQRASFENFVVSGLFTALKKKNGFILKKK